MYSGHAHVSAQCRQFLRSFICSVFSETILTVVVWSATCVPDASFPLWVSLHRSPASSVHHLCLSFPVLQSPLLHSSTSPSSVGPFLRLPDFEGYPVVFRYTLLWTICPFLLTVQMGIFLLLLLICLFLSI